MNISRQVWQKATRLVYISSCFDAAISPTTPSGMVKEMQDRLQLFSVFCWKLDRLSHLLCILSVGTHRPIKQLFFSIVLLLRLALSHFSWDRLSSSFFARRVCSGLSSRLLGFSLYRCWCRTSKYREVLLASPDRCDVLANDLSGHMVIYDQGLLFRSYIFLILYNANKYN